MKHPLSQDQQREYPTTTVLRDLASQENCDGEPYDQMIEAAEQITEAVEIIKVLIRSCRLAGAGEYQLSRAKILLNKIAPLQGPRAHP